MVGPVGSGKSSLLAVALGELQAISRKKHKTEEADEEANTTDVTAEEQVGVELVQSEQVRSIAKDCRIAYCAQRP